LPASQQRKTPTIRDVAREAGVSVATISRFLNNPAILQAETARRVEAVMEELEYIPKLAARNLSSRNTRTLGLITEYLDGEFFLPLLTGMESAAFEHNYSLLISSTRHWKESRQRMLPLGPHNCDGLLVFPGSLPAEYLERWQRQEFPMILIQHMLAELPALPRITIENRQSSRDATLHLVQVHGCRRILYLAGPEGHHDARQRLAGYQDGLAAAGLPADSQLILSGQFNEESAFAVCRQAIQQGLQFDAILAGDDDSALGALESLRAAGLEAVPLIGFDGILLGQRSRPPLATVLAPTEEVGELAVQHLVGILEGKQVPLESQLPCTPHFFGSCGCPLP